MCWGLNYVLRSQLCVEVSTYVLRSQLMCWGLNLCVEVSTYVLRSQLMCWGLNYVLRSKLCWGLNLCVRVSTYVWGLNLCVRCQLMCQGVNLCVEVLTYVSRCQLWYLKGMVPVENIFLYYMFLCNYAYNNYGTE